jgi:hypothetical protein
MAILRKESKKEAELRKEEVELYTEPDGEF